MLDIKKVAQHYIHAMLTEAHKERQVQWARLYLNDNWHQRLFSDETAIQLF